MESACDVKAEVVDMFKDFWVYSCICPNGQCKRNNHVRGKVHKEGETIEPLTPFRCVCGQHIQPRNDL